MATSITRNNVFLGTEIKLNIEIEPIGHTTMDDYDFVVEVYCSTKKVQSFTKQDTIRINAWNYMVLVDTEVLGAGDMKCKITAYIPDSDFPDLVRTEVACVDTNITINKNL